MGVQSWQFVLRQGSSGEASVGASRTIRLFSRRLLGTVPQQILAGHRCRPGIRRPSGLPFGRLGVVGDR